jgi:steroid delta-isomerase-like uncharacterized protein
MSHDGKDLVRRYYEEVVTKGDLSLVDEVISDNYVGHTPLSPDVRGIEGVKQLVSTMRSAFPDVCVTVEDTVSEGNKVASRIKMVGTHKGDYGSIPASGKTVTVTGMNITIFEGGKCVENWNCMDMLGLMKQIGGAV